MDTKYYQIGTVDIEICKDYLEISNNDYDIPNENIFLDNNESIKLYKILKEYYNDDS